MNRVVRLTDSNDPLADAAAIQDWGLVLAALITHPDADAGVAQIHRVAWQIIDHARAIKMREEAKARRCA